MATAKKKVTKKKTTKKKVATKTTKPVVKYSTRQEGRALARKGEL